MTNSTNIEKAFELATEQYESLASMLKRHCRHCGASRSRCTAGRAMTSADLRAATGELGSGLGGDRQLSRTRSHARRTAQRSGTWPTR